MTTSTPKDTAEMSTFSYAQAAKGLVSTPTSSNTEKEVQATLSSKEKTAAKVTGDHDVHEDLKQTSSFTDESMDTSENCKNKMEQESSKSIPSGVSSPSLATTSTEAFPKEDDMSLTPNGSSDSSWDKQSQASLAIEKTARSEDEPKKNPEDRTEKEPTPPKELKEAPIPAVNIWQLRREAQEAKARANATVKPAPAATKGTLPKPLASQSNPEGRSDTTRTASRRKSSESFAERKKAGDGE